MMKLFACGLALLASCTKVNPNACCTDPQDCSAVGLPDTMTCSGDLVCRGHQCIAETCTTQAQCDSTAPYCIAGTCAASCADDSQCPGFGQAAADKFCVGGACVACRQDHAADDCTADMPVCSNGACRGCQRPDECASGACADDGTCIPEAEILFASPNGDNAGACTRAAPCSLTRAVSLSTETIELLPGTFSMAGTVALSGKRRLVGAGLATVVTNSMPGAIFDLAPQANITFDSFEVSGATSNSSNLLGDAIKAFLPSGTRTITARRMKIARNSHIGIQGATITLTVTGSNISSNGLAGIEISDSTLTVDGCVLSDNANNGALNLDGGYFSISNSFVYRNSVALTTFSFATQPSLVQFTTFADNVKSISCSDAQTRIDNSILARNGDDPTTSMCGLGTNLIVADPTPIKFHSPDQPPYDYHLTHGSSAIDAAGSGALDHDYDGDIRPLGAARDLGADEAE